MDRDGQQLTVVEPSGPRHDDVKIPPTGVFQHAIKARTRAPTLGLDFLVKRIIQIITFDPAILNEKSPANSEALSWYRDAVRRHAHAFPTDTALLATATPEKKMNWTNIASEPVKVVVACSHCGGKLSLPVGKRGKVKCPRCQQSFEART